MSDKTIGYLLRTFHAGMPTYAILVLVFGPQLFALITLAGLFIAFIGFFVFNGCILSSIEYKLDNVDITLMDPLVELFRYEVTPENRMNVAKWTAIIYIICAILVYYVRFGRLYLHNSIYEDMNIFKGFYQRGSKKE